MVRDKVFGKAVVVGCGRGLERLMKSKTQRSNNSAMSELSTPDCHCSCLDVVELRNKGFSRGKTFGCLRVFRLMKALKGQTETSSRVYTGS